MFGVRDIYHEIVEVDYIHHSMNVVRHQLLKTNLVFKWYHSMYFYKEISFGFTENELKCWTGFIVVVY